MIAKFSYMVSTLPNVFAPMCLMAAQGSSYSGPMRPMALPCGDGSELVHAHEEVAERCAILAIRVGDTGHFAPSDAALLAAERRCPTFWCGSGFSRESTARGSQIGDIHQLQLQMMGVPKFAEIRRISRNSREIPAPISLRLAYQHRWLRNSQT
jgi:hypothetical protein